jgi:hypothetical protein
MWIAIVVFCVAVYTAFNGHVVLLTATLLLSPEWSSPAAQVLTVAGSRESG